VTAERDNPILAAAVTPKAHESTSEIGTRRDRPKLSDDKGWQRSVGALRDPLQQRVEVRSDDLAHNAGLGVSGGDIVCGEFQDVVGHLRRLPRSRADR